MVGFALFGIQIFILIAHIILAVENRRRFKLRWKPGLTIGVVLFLMTIPSLVFSFACMDDSGIEESMRIAFLVGMILGVILQILNIGWNMILFIVADAEWRKTGTGGLLGRRSRINGSWRHMTASFATGVVIASVSIVVFTLLGIEEGESILALQELFPKAGSASPWIAMPVITLFFSVHAVTEELVFRGGMLAFVIRKSGDRKILQYIGITAITLAWAVAHIPNTNAPVVKVIQMFITGIILVEITRRSSLRNAIAAHFGLNLTCAVVPYIWLLIY